MNRTVSCVCPTYARVEYLERAAKLFLAQSWQRAELIVIDDSPKNMRASLPASPRIKVIYLDDKVSMGAKHNIGLELAQGEYVAHWDDDDWQSPRRLVKQIEHLATDHGDVCGFAMDMLLTTGDARFWRFDRTYQPKKALVGNATVKVSVPFMDGSAMFKRSAVGAARYPDIPVGQKVVFLDEVRRQGARLTTLTNDGDYVYVRHRGPKYVNTWQYGSDRRLLPVSTPSWFPVAHLDFYKKAV